MVTIKKGFLQRLENHHSGTVTEHGPICSGIEGSAMTVRRDHQSFLEEISSFLRKRERNAPGKSHMALSAHETLTGQMNGDQRCGTCCEQCEAGSLEVELIGNSRGNIIPVVEEESVIEFGRVRGYGLNPANPLMVFICSEIAADHSLKSIRIVASIFQGFPGAFMKDADLRVHPLRFFRRVRKKVGIKGINILNNPFGFNIIRVFVFYRANSRILKLLIRKKGYGLASFYQVVPKLLNVSSAGKPAGHADDGYIVTEFFLILPVSYHGLPLVERQ